MAVQVALRLARGQQLPEVQELRALAFDGQTGNFVVGEVVTGVTSGATGTVVQQVDNGTDGILYLDKVSGVFQDNEDLTGDVAGVADVDGTLSAPLLVPDDQMIVQIDTEDMTKADALELMRQIEHYINLMDWPTRA